MARMLEGKRGVVFGVANGKSIAAGIARAVVEQGAEAVLVCQNEKARKYAQPVADELGAELLVCDVTKPEELHALADGVGERLDFLVHAMAFAPKAALDGRLSETTADEFALTMDVSVHSLCRIVDALEPQLLAGRATVVTLTYEGAQRVAPGYGIMGVAKAALEATVRQLAHELGPRDIRVHAVSPGPIRTRAACGIGSYDALEARDEARTMLPALATQDDVGELVAALCGPAGRAMTGQTIFVDAGAHGRI